MKQEISNLIGKNRLFEAIQTLSKQSLKSKDRKALSLLQGRLNAVNEKIRIGILSDSDANLELNKIRNSVLDLNESVFRKAEKSSISFLQTNLGKGTIALGVILLLLGGYFFKSSEQKCDSHKVAILVADFQNVENEKEIDAFSNSLVVRMDNLLDNQIYDVTPIGHQTRNKKKYHDYIRQEYFKSSCDSSGLFVNGFLSVEDEIFNVYMTLANLRMNVPEFSKENSIDLDNPAGIDFQIKNDAAFLSDFIYGILMSYEGKPKEALDQFFALEKGDNNDILQNDKNFRATMAHFKGNCFAMRGDNKRAESQYKIVEKYGTPEIKKVASLNKLKAKKVNERMKADPDLKLLLVENLTEHTKFEKDLEKFLNNFGKEVVNIFKKIK